MYINSFIKMSPSQMEYDALCGREREKEKTGVINDPLGQTHSEHCFRLKFVLF